MFFQAATAQALSANVVELRDWDVQLDRKGSKSKGNQHFLKQVLPFRPEYFQAKNNKEKRAIGYKALRAWKSSVCPPPRFLKWIEETEEWKVMFVNDEEAVKRVMKTIYDEKIGKSVGMEIQGLRKKPPAQRQPGPTYAANGMPVAVQGHPHPQGFPPSSASGAANGRPTGTHGHPLPLGVYTSFPLSTANGMPVAVQGHPHPQGFPPSSASGAVNGRPTGTHGHPLPFCVYTSFPLSAASEAPMAMNGPSPSQGFLSSTPTSTASGMPMTMHESALSKVSRAHAGTLPVNAQGGSKYPPMVTPFSRGETVGLSWGQADLNGLALPDLGGPHASSLLPRAKHMEPLRTLTQPFDESQLKKAPPMERTRREVPVEVQIEHSPPMVSWSKDYMKQAPMVDGAANMVSPDSQGQSPKEMWSADGYEESPSPPRQKTTGLVAGDGLASLSSLDVDSPILFGDTDSLLSFYGQEDLPSPKKMWPTDRPPPSPLGRTGETEGSVALDDCSSLSSVEVDAASDTDSLLSFVREEYGPDFDFTMDEA